MKTAVNQYGFELLHLFVRLLDVVDLDKRILADAVLENVGTILTHDTGNEVGLTMQDGQVCTFVEISSDYPPRIRQIKLLEI